MTQSTIFALCAGGFVLGLIAVIIDRLNFPQRRFVPRGVPPQDHGPNRDRTGAHIVDDPNQPSNAVPRQPSGTNDDPD